MNISAGDYVTLTSPQGNLTPFGMLPRSRRFLVAGIFDSGFYDYDANWGFVTLSSAQGLAGVGDVVSLLEVRVTELDDASAVADDLVRRSGAGFTATTWMDENRALFRALSLEKLVTALFIGLITFVAGLNILVVLTMTVTDRAKDIAVLMAIGTRPRQIRRVFVLQGLVVSISGTAAGLVAGYGFAWCADRWRLIPLNPEVYAIPYVPFHPNGFDAIWIAAAAARYQCRRDNSCLTRSAARILPRRYPTLRVTVLLIFSIRNSTQGHERRVVKSRRRVGVAANWQPVGRGKGRAIDKSERIWAKVSFPQNQMYVNTRTYRRGSSASKV